MAKAISWAETGAYKRRVGDQIPLETVVVHPVNDDLYTESNGFVKLTRQKVRLDSTSASLKSKQLMR